ncbi:hypothetical protein FIU87_11955 [Bacillus sp. THAF10]|uniref:YpoC family protein n=1 Tax=Bacillus sp. THAF10 TaxID=2587848 RepID=UPI00126908BF|nr:hypothetical protein [Bacillus sp. THAF10]QFT89362.1 hypothetical protein FIU87_11955 [Bacillus sp. THAF10]
MRVPEAFWHPYFYSEGDSLHSKSFSSEDIIEVPFKFDIAYYLGAAPDNLPWESLTDSIPLLIVSWKAQMRILTELHEKRSRQQARQYIIPSISWYLQMLFWINDQPVRGLTNWKVDCDALKWKPVNVVERVDFALKKPNLYHSFIQLQQLFNETEKIFYKKQALKIK